MHHFCCCHPSKSFWRGQKSSLFFVVAVVFAAMSDKNSKFYFTPEERDAFIDFVRENEILYRNKHKGARDVKEKNRLWKQIGAKINKKRMHRLNYARRLSITVDNGQHFYRFCFCCSGNLQEKVVHAARRFLAIHVEVGWQTRVRDTLQSEIADVFVGITNRIGARVSACAFTTPLTAPD